MKEAIITACAGAMLWWTGASGAPPRKGAIARSASSGKGASSRAASRGRISARTTGRGRAGSADAAAADQAIQFAVDEDLFAEPQESEAEKKERLEQEKRAKIAEAVGSEKSKIEMAAKEDKARREIEAANQKTEEAKEEIAALILEIDEIEHKVLSVDEKMQKDKEAEIIASREAAAAEAEAIAASAKAVQAKADELEQ